MFSAFLTVTSLVVIVGCLTYLWVLRRSGATRTYHDAELRWMPAELRSARLIVSERDTSALIDGTRINLRPDQVYRTADGRVVPVDTKVRNARAAYPYDIIQLSLQAVALSQHPANLQGAHVGLHGYVRCVRKGRGRSPARPHYVKVQLLGEQALGELVRRYRDVVAGRVIPGCQSNPRACAGCGYRDRCDRRTIR